MVVAIVELCRIQGSFMNNMHKMEVIIFLFDVLVVESIVLMHFNFAAWHWSTLLKLKDALVLLFYVKDLKLSLYLGGIYTLSEVSDVNAISFVQVAEISLVPHGLHCCRLCMRLLLFVDI